MKATKIATILIVLLALCGQWASAEVKAKLDIQPRLLRLGENARCILTVQGAKNPPRPRFPDQEEFRIRTAGTSKQTNIQNFKATTSIVFSYVLTPLKTGSISVGPYEYEVEGETIHLPAIDLKVLSSSSQNQNRNGEERSLSDMLFARFELPEGKIYSQQVFPLVLKIYAQEGLNVTGNFEPYGFPETGITLGGFQSYGRERTTIDGRIYTVFKFAAEAQALSSGEYEFQPGLRAGMRVNNRPRSRSPFGDSFFNSFFDRAQVEPVDVPMESLKLTVEPLPTTNRPPSFSGAVGEFDFKVRVEPRELDAGEPITVTMTIEGKGNIDNITAPALNLGEQFKTYEASLISSDQNGTLGSARKVFEQVAIPRSGEIQELPAIEFSYFNPKSRDFKTSTRGPFPLTVRKTTNQVVQISAGSGEGASKRGAEILGSDIVYLKDAPQEDADSVSLTLSFKPVFCLLQSIPLLALAGILLWKRRREFLEGNVAAARRQKAPQAARAGLQRAADALDDNDRHAFFEALWQAAADYFGHSLNLAPGEIDTPRALRFCRAGKLPDDMVARLEGIMLRCEQERFATMASGGEKLGAEETQILDDLRGILKRCQKVKHQSGSVTLRMTMVLSSIVLVGIVFLSLAAPQGVDSISRRFAKAAEYYDAGKLDAALNEYRAMLDRDHRSEALYFNMGNCYFRQRDFGRAILSYRRAWYLDPNDPDINANMDLAVSEAGALTPEMSAIMRVITRLSSRQWLAIMLSFYWLSVALLAGSFLSNRYRGALRRTFYVALLGLVIGLTGILGWLSRQQADEAVVIENGQEALFAPIADSTAHFAVPAGSIVEVVDESDSWLQIQSGQNRGWIPDTACQRVIPARL